ncbi:MAG: hypothetical protein K6L76_04955 [Agarilytica sp.]
MATTQEKKILRTALEKYEGKIEHMYLDTKGYVTVGVGHLLKDVAAAQKLNLIQQKGGKKATAADIKADYDAVKKQPMGLFAALYKQHTKLKLSAADIDALTDKHIDSFEKELNIIYGVSEFTAFPSEVRLALFDMIFNLGMPKLRNGFPTMNKHIKAKDWAAAAGESSRKGIAKARNQYVEDLFLKAAKAKTP